MLLSVAEMLVRSMPLTKVFFYLTSMALDQAPLDIDDSPGKLLDCRAGVRTAGTGAWPFTGLAGTHPAVPH